MTFSLKAYQKCSPSTTLSDGTCFVREELLCIVQAAESLLGMKHETEKDLADMNNEELLNSLDKFMRWNAANSNAWLENRRLMNKISVACPKLAETIIYYRLRPSYAGAVARGVQRAEIVPTKEDPKKSESSSLGWTSNRQIDKVMWQFVRLFRDNGMPVVYAGAFNNKPMDWLCHSNGKCPSPMTVHFEDPSNNDIPWCAILNTSEKGTHWVAVFRENAHSPLEYFDSFGNPVPKSLKPALEWITKDAKDCEFILRITRNHQKDDYSCGPFSIFFIVSRHKEKLPFDWFESHTVTQKMIKKFRASLFDIDPGKFVQKPF